MPRLNNTKSTGFTLSELLAVVAITGVLSSIALPNYLTQVNRTRQNEAVSTVSQIQTTIAAYADEFGVLPKSWNDLNQTNAIMTNNGPATTENFAEITTASKFYKIQITNSDNQFTITANHIDKDNLYVIGCIDLTNGASAIIKGPKPPEPVNPDDSAEEPETATKTFCPHPDTDTDTDTDTTSAEGSE